MSLETIEDGWARYREKVYDGPLSDVQNAETRQAFFSAIVWFLNQQLRNADQPEAEALAWLEARQAEAIGFFANKAARQSGGAAGPLTGAAGGPLTVREGEEPKPDTPDAVTHDAMKVTAWGIAQRLKPLMPPGCEFALFLYQFGPGGWMTYIANAERDDMLRMLKQFIHKQEGGR